MIQDASLESLGLGEDASPEQIAASIARKRAQLQQALAQAPTDALRKKYRQQLQKFEELESELAPPEQPAARRGPSLSQTKLADLPQSATQFDAGHSAQVNLQPGQVLANRYEIREQIGAGGMGAVYHAFDRTKQEDIALKVLLPALLQNERARQRFLDEARISARLSHPNIVNVHDVQQDGDFFFLTMELLEGQDLRQLMEARQLSRQPFDEAEARKLATTLANALAYAHQHTVHRDIKPDNIWVTEDGDYKIMDFGIARVQSTSQRTQTGAAMGTAYYMAPEQLKGTSSVDGRADQYALGVLLYELLAGEVPAGRFKPLRELRKDLGKGFAACVEKALETGPGDRFANMPAFAAALEKKGGGFELNLPWKGIRIAAGLLVAILGLGGLAASGGFSLDGLEGLLPMSKEEIAAERASLAKIQGEIKVLKQRLESSRRSLDSDVRDAERNGSDNLEALRHWQRLTEDGLFAGSRITELEGDLSMAETLLRDEAFEQARPVLERVRAGYQQLQEDFSSGGKLQSAQQQAGRAEAQWKAMNIEFDTAPEPATEAQAAQMTAVQQQRGGELTAALQSWQAAEQQWLLAREGGKALQRARDSGHNARTSWVKLKQQYGLSDPAVVGEAFQVWERAQEQQLDGMFNEAEASWYQTAELWQAARVALQPEVEIINEEREARAAASKRQRDAQRARLAALVKKATPEMVEVPSGSFWLGGFKIALDPSSVAGARARVTIQPFKMSKYEVTFSQYDAFAEATGRAKPDDSGWGRGDRPVINVSWEDASEFATWLSKNTGETFRLPSEAEWEYAARGGTYKTFSWGYKITCSQARYGRSADGACASGKEGTVPVGSYTSNKFGLYDMHGNVYEWTQDCWKFSNEDIPTDGSAWVSGDCGTRVARGGGWYNKPQFLKLYQRNYAAITTKDNNIGFRLAQDIE